MIADMNALLDYTRKRGEKRPALKDRIVLERPGCSAIEAALIMVKLPSMPNCYIDIVRDVHLDGKSIGYFQLSPGSGNQLVDKLVQCNSESVTPMAKRFKVDGVYGVASWEADPIGIVFKPIPFTVGQVVRYNSGNPQKNAAVLANDFLQFLLIAGNLDAIRDKYVDVNDVNAATKEFNECLRLLNISCHPGMLSEWTAIAHVVFS